MNAVRWDLLEANPALRAEPPEANRPVVRVWSPSELRTFLAFVETDRWLPAWLMAASTGARRGEILGVRWSDLTLAPEIGEPRMVIANTLIAVKSEVRKPTPRTANGERVIPLSDRLAAELRAWRAQQREERMRGGAEWAENAAEFPDLVFRHADGCHVHPDRFSD